MSNETHRSAQSFCGYRTPPLPTTRIGCYLVMYGKRPGLSPRDRSLATVASLISLYRINELPFHLKHALENGITREELVEAITHLAFYAGWPVANTALPILRRVFEEAAA